MPDREIRAFARIVPRLDANVVGMAAAAVDDGRCGAGEIDQHVL
ncbi:hypothetical protein [Neomoorella thermoacetica]|nr:hypothetical protein [Moorella thermoacetica]